MYFPKKSSYDCICLKIVDCASNMELSNKYLRYPISAIQGINPSEVFHIKFYTKSYLTINSILLI